ncbi:MAG: hypothetical protein ACPHJV_04405, partial [Miltoncostaeaceae bacterium]
MTGSGDQQRAESGGSDNGAPHVASTRTIVLGVVLVVVLAVGLVLLLGKAAGYREVLNALEGADGAWLIACLFLEAAAYAGYVVCMRAIIAQDDGVDLSGMNA